MITSDAAYRLTTWNVVPAGWEDASGQRKPAYGNFEVYGQHDASLMAASMMESGRRTGMARMIFMRVADPNDDGFCDGAYATYSKTYGWRPDPAHSDCYDCLHRIDGACTVANGRP